MGLGNLFFSAPLLLSTIGGAAGAVLGALITTTYAISQGWPTVIPVWALVGGMGATLVIGAIAGLYPAVRAARLAPTAALAST